MGGSSKQPATTTTTTQPPAYALPYLEYGAQEAKNNYDAGAPSYYPGSTTVPFSPETNQGLNTITNLANQGGQLTPAATNTLLSTIRGDNQVNPFLAGAVRSATVPLFEQFNQETLPALQSIFERSAGSGSAEGFAAERAANTLGRALADKSGELAFGSAENERARQLAATQMAPGLDAARFADAQALLGVGAAREGQSAAELQSNIDRYNYEQNLPALRLNQYLSQIQGASPGSISTTQARTPTNSALTSTLFGGIGGGALGAGAATALGLTGGLVAAPAIGLGALYGLGTNKGWF